MLDAVPETGIAAMAASYRTDSLSQRILRTALLDPIDDARDLLQRARTNEAFQRYLRKRKLYALPLVAGIALTSLALAGATMIFFARSGTLAALAAIVLAPLVLIASLSVQGHVLLSWLEGRSLAKILERRGPRARGPVGAWLARSVRVDMGPFPQVPWIPALVFVLLPAAMLARVAALAALGLAAFQIVAVIFYARLDPGSGVDRSSAPRGNAAPKPAAAATSPRYPQIRAEEDDIGRTAPRFDIGRSTLALRRFLESCVRNLLPFIEYCVLAAGVLAVAAGHRSSSERSVSLGLLLIGAAFLLAGLASIATQRLSFRFHRSAQQGRAGTTALITGMMQVIVGGLAVVVAHALATRAWQTKLDTLLANPWPVLIPFGLLLIGAGLLLVRRPSDRIGILETVFFVAPKTLTGVAALIAGTAVLLGGVWQFNDPQMFHSFIRLFPDEDLQLIESWWGTAIALVR